MALAQLGKQWREHQYIAREQMLSDQDAARCGRRLAPLHTQEPARQRARQHPHPTGEAA
jgi:hypothetical protein